MTWRIGAAVLFTVAVGGCSGTNVTVVGGVGEDGQILERQNAPPIEGSIDPDGGIKEITPPPSPITPIIPVATPEPTATPRPK